MYHPTGVFHTCIPIGGEGMGVFEREHLSDKIPSTPCRGPSRGLLLNAPMASTSFGSTRPQGGLLATQE
jgi:hypothetical protein